MMNWLRTMLTRWRVTPRIEIGSTGFASIGGDGKTHRVEWHDIVKVAAYKRDLITTDEIMLAIEVGSRPGIVQEFSQEWTGFVGLVGSLEKQLGISPSWYVDVMQPAFATNFRILYDRTTSPFSSPS